MILTVTTCAAREETQQNIFFSEKCSKQAIFAMSMLTDNKLGLNKILCCVLYLHLLCSQITE
jgi:hypothetical protein